jgi:hypothetical protein
MFFAMAQNMTYSIIDPYNPAIKPDGSGANPPPTQGFPTDLFDIYPNADFVPRYDIVNGTAPAGTGWKTAASTLPTDPNQPYYMARDMGPKYLYNGSFYQVIQPINTVAQSTYHNFSISWISIPELQNNQTVAWYKSPGHAGLRVEDGALILKVEGYDDAQLLHGDVAVIPAGTNFAYHGAAGYTKFLYFAAGTGNLDSTLISKSVSWNAPVWPSS